MHSRSRTAIAFGFLRDAETEHVWFAPTGQTLRTPRTNHHEGNVLGGVTCCAFRTGGAEAVPGARRAAGFAVGHISRVWLAGGCFHCDTSSVNKRPKNT